jgi:hypothetical protein
MNKMSLVLLAAVSGTWVTCEANAEETKKAPLTMTITCSDDVSPGTMVLSKPPKVNCKDLKMMTRFVGTGFEIGPFESHQLVVESINKMLIRIERRSKSQGTDKVASDNNGSWTNFNNLTGPPPMTTEPFVPGVNRVNAFKAGVRSHDVDDFDSKRSAAFREIEARETTCSGIVNINDILSGKCGDVKIKVEE